MTKNLKSESILHAERQYCIRSDTTGHFLLEFKEMHERLQNEALHMLLIQILNKLDAKE